MFGHEELIPRIRRRTRVRAVTQSNVIYLNKQDFFTGTLLLT